MTGLGRRSVKALMESLGSFRIGSRVYIRRLDLESFLRRASGASGSRRSPLEDRR